MPCTLPVANMLLEKVRLEVRGGGTGKAISPRVISSNSGRSRSGGRNNTKTVAVRLKLH